MFLLLDEKDVHLMGQCCPIHSLMVNYKGINATRIVGFSGSFLSYVISTMSHLVLKPVCSIQILGAALILYLVLKVFLRILAPHFEQLTGAEIFWGLCLSTSIIHFLFC